MIIIGSYYTHYKKLKQSVTLGAGVHTLSVKLTASPTFAFLDIVLCIFHTCTVVAVYLEAPVLQQQLLFFLKRMLRNFCLLAVLPSESCAVNTTSFYFLLSPFEKGTCK